MSNAGAFRRNACKNERIGPWGGRSLDRPMLVYFTSRCYLLKVFQNEVCEPNNKVHAENTLECP